MKKVFFSMAGIALLAGSALAFTTANDEVPPCEDENVPANCIDPIPTSEDACCFQETGSGIQYFRLLEE